MKEIAMLYPYIYFSTTILTAYFCHNTTIRADTKVIKRKDFNDRYRVENIEKIK